MALCTQASHPGLSSQSKDPQRRCFVCQRNLLQREPSAPLQQKEPDALHMVLHRKAKIGALRLHRWCAPKSVYLVALRPLVFDFWLVAQPCQLVGHGGLVAVVGENQLVCEPHHALVWNRCTGIWVVVVGWSQKPVPRFLGLYCEIYYDAKAQSDVCCHCWYPKNFRIHHSPHQLCPGPCLQLQWHKDRQPVLLQNRAVEHGATLWAELWANAMPRE